MNSLRRAWRILRTVVRYRLDELLQVAGMEPAQLPWLLRMGWYLSPLRLIPAPDLPPGTRLRLALEELGPVFVKFGQILSTRRDLLPQDLADELAMLQDQVPPFPGEAARALVETALGTPLTDVFSHFDTTPLASASVAQVHVAELLDGTEVVVKVIRPDIEPVIREDLQLLHLIARALEASWTEARRLHLGTIVDDYEYTILDELDLTQEGSNTARLRRNFAGSDLLYVPRVYWDHTRTNMLVMERIHGVPIGQVQRLIDAGTDMKKLAERGVETFFTQVFEDNFFHADMHPGNIFVDITDPAEPNYIAIDCAIIGSLTPEDQDYLARNLLAFFNQDYNEVARLHVESGWVPPQTNVAEFERVIRDVCTPIFNKPLKEISFGAFLVTLFQTARRFDMEVQPQLVLLQKTLLNIEGLGRQLYPDLDLWHTAKPFMERWMASRVGPQATLREFADKAPELLDALPRLPGLLLEATTALRRLDAMAAEQRAALARISDELPGRRRALAWQRWLGAGAFGLAAVLVLLPVASATPSTEALLAAGLTALAGMVLLLRG